MPKRGKRSVPTGGGERTPRARRHIEAKTIELYDGRQLQLTGFPFVKDLTTLYHDAEKYATKPDSVEQSRILREISRIIGSSGSHKDDRNTLGLAETIRQLVGYEAPELAVQEAAAPEVAAPESPATGVSDRYIGQLTEATRSLTRYVADLKTTLGDEGSIKAADIATVLTEGKDGYTTAMSTMSPLLELTLDERAKDRKEQKDYVALVARVKDLQGQMGEMFGRLEAKAGEADRGYDVKLPGEPADAGPSPKDAPYGMRIQVGRRDALIVFPRDELPGTEAEFLAYLGDESNFPDRDVRGVVRSFLDKTAAGATINYIPGNEDPDAEAIKLTGDQPFGDAFADYYSAAQLEEIREAAAAPPPPSSPGPTEKRKKQPKPKPVGKSSTAKPAEGGAVLLSSGTTTYQRPTMYTK